MSKRSRKPLPSPKAARVLLMALPLKSAPWLKNVHSMSAHVNWLGKNSLQAPKFSTHNCETRINKNMTAQNQNQSGYMLLFRGTDLRNGLSPEELQKVTDNWMAWFKRLTEEGKAVAGNPLEREGKIVSGKDRIVSDGPVAESKEAIGGYFLLDVNTIDEAVAIARECPCLPYGIRVEVRPVACECPIAADIRKEAQFAQV